MISIGIRSLKTRCIIGILARERLFKQTIICNVSATIASSNFDLSGGNANNAQNQIPLIDYTVLARLFTEHAQKMKYYLLESLASGYKNLLLQHFPHIHSLTIEIQKPSALQGSCTAFVRLNYESRPIENKATVNI